MTSKDILAIFDQLQDHQSIRLKALREARQKTGQLFPVIKDRRLKLKMIQEKEADQAVCSALAKRLENLVPIACKDSEHPEIQNLFL